jgi:hypothetical protein
MAGVCPCLYSFIGLIKTDSLGFHNLSSTYGEVPANFGNRSDNSGKVPDTLGELSDISGKASAIRGSSRQLRGNPGHSGNVPTTRESPRHSGKLRHLRERSGNSGKASGTSGKLRQHRESTRQLSGKSPTTLGTAPELSGNKYPELLQPEKTLFLQK